MAAELGFEPRHTESESAVLPLHNSARFKIRLTNRRVGSASQSLLVQHERSHGAYHDTIPLKQFC